MTTDTGFGFFKGCKVTILYLFHLWFYCLWSCPEGIYSYKLLKYDFKMSQTKTSAVNAKRDLCLSLKLHKLSHCSIPCPASCLRSSEESEKCCLLFPYMLSLLSASWSTRAMKGFSGWLRFWQACRYCWWRSGRTDMTVLENKTNCYCIVTAA